ncbi:MAG: L-ribulose-5-phosphate 4-epimerase [Candidatus Marinimicrobia bacterium]|nr:L-ribulose-5-phosphate 4-epimerase [Candidatus Neomarinimicrobiota bacterium]MCF7827865.1 L-ribulose-5-phosphate 4-epimerase [Candidatus Neomarinimicrobiota bacterium]MCF7879380.1 L-ribulose-5-phosphate 4-epimerase [Candidatus Neomarinimicrobiota bacterium]
MSKYQDLKEQVYECNMELPEHGLVIYTFGNVSAIDRDAGVFAIKPSGVDYEKLKPEDIVIVDLDYNVVEGDLRPSSDTKTHAVLYKNFPNIGGIVHTHSTYSVAWAQALKPLPIFGTTHADHLQNDVPITEVMSDEMIQGDYEEETGHQIVNTFQDLSYEETQMVLVARHGPFTWGKTPEDAVYNSVVLEELAKMALFTRQINPEIPRLKQSIIDKHYLRKHGEDAYYGQD